MTDSISEAASSMVHPPKGRPLRVLLRVKVALFVIVPLLLVGMSLSIIFGVEQSRNMMEEFQSHGETLATILADTSQPLVIKNTASSRKQLQDLTDIVTSDKESAVTSVIVMNEDGDQLTGSGAAEEVPKGIIEKAVASEDGKIVEFFDSEIDHSKRIAISRPILARAILRSTSSAPSSPSSPAAPAAPGSAPAMPSSAPAAPPMPGSAPAAPPMPGSAPAVPGVALAFPGGGLKAPAIPDINLDDVIKDTRSGTVVVSVNRQAVLTMSRSTLLTGVGISAAVTMLAAALSLWLATYTLRPLRLVGSMLREIAKGEADLTKRIVVQSNDEIGDLANWFNEFVESIQNIIRQVTETANRVVVTSEELGATSQEVTAGAQEISSAVHAIARGVLNQQARVKETSIIMDQMSRALHEVSSGARNATETSSQTRDIASLNRIDIESANQVLLRITEFIRSSGESISSLNESSKMIGAAADVIRNMARTTNLLSLNASIEAARATSEGKGFGVVAEEIGNLARQSAVATDEIDVMIRSLRRGVEAVVEEMKGGERQIRNVGDVSGRAGEALQRIIEAVEQVAVTVQQISASIERQVEGTEKLVKALDEIASVAEDVSASTEQVSAAAEQQNNSMERMSASAQDLSAMADDLQRLVHRFKI